MLVAQMFLRPQRMPYWNQGVARLFTLTRELIACRGIHMATDICVYIYIYIYRLVDLIRAQPRGEWSNGILVVAIRLPRRSTTSKQCHYAECDRFQE